MENMSKESAMLLGKAEILLDLSKQVVVMKQKGVKVSVVAIEMLKSRIETVLSFAEFTLDEDSLTDIDLMLMKSLENIYGIL